MHAFFQVIDRRFVVRIVGENLVEDARRRRRIAERLLGNEAAPVEQIELSPARFGRALVADAFDFFVERLHPLFGAAELHVQRADAVEGIGVFRRDLHLPAACGQRRIEVLLLLLQRGGLAEELELSFLAGRQIDELHQDFALLFGLLGLAVQLLERRVRGDVARITRQNFSVFLNRQRRVVHFFEIQSGGAAMELERQGRFRFLRLLDVSRREIGELAGLLRQLFDPHADAHVGRVFANGLQSHEKGAVFLPKAIFVDVADSADETFLLGQRRSPRQTHFEDFRQVRVVLLGGEQRLQNRRHFHLGVGNIEQRFQRGQRRRVLWAPLQRGFVILKCLRRLFAVQIAEPHVDLDTEVARSGELAALQQDIDQLLPPIELDEQPIQNGKGVGVLRIERHDLLINVHRVRLVGELVQTNVAELEQELQLLVTLAVGQQRDLFGENVGQFGRIALLAQQARHLIERLRDRRLPSSPHLANARRRLAACSSASRKARPSAGGAAQRRRLIGDRRQNALVFLGDGGEILRLLPETLELLANAFVFRIDVKCLRHVRERLRQVIGLGFVQTRRIDEQLALGGVIGGGMDAHETGVEQLR